VFGRGSIELLEPENPRIVAHVRRFEEDVILCVANLSHVPQPVALDLSPFAGMVPVEMLGYTAFPPVGADAYPLTLGAYGYYWFELQRRDG